MAIQIDMEDNLLKNGNNYQPIEIDISPDKDIAKGEISKNETFKVIDINPDTSNSDKNEVVTPGISSGNTDKDVSPEFVSPKLIRAVAEKIPLIINVLICKFFSEDVPLDENETEMVTFASGLLLKKYAKKLENMEEVFAIVVVLIIVGKRIGKNKKERENDNNNFRPPENGKD
jgi:hypothetical protein